MYPAFGPRTLPIDLGDDGPAGLGPGKAGPGAALRRARRVRVAVEQHDEWAEGRRYLGLEVFARSRVTAVPDTIVTPRR